MSQLRDEWIEVFERDLSVFELRLREYTGEEIKDYIRRAQVRTMFSRMLIGFIRENRGGIGMSVQDIDELFHVVGGWVCDALPPAPPSAARSRSTH